MTPVYEPIIVTTLRRFARRGASPGLLQRLAGGRRDWRLLNEWWNVDGQGAGIRLRLPERIEHDLGDCVPGLSLGERRLAILQIAEECAEAGASFPRVGELAAYFDVSRHTVSGDLEVLRVRGQLAPRVAEEGAP
jgi:hypothetical protein